MASSRLHNTSWDIDWSDSAQETMSDSELHMDSIDVDVSYVDLSRHLAGIFDRTSGERDDRLQSTRMSAFGDVKSPILTPYHSNSLLNVRRLSDPLDVDSWDLLDIDDDDDLSMTPVKMQGDCLNHIARQNVATNCGSQIGKLPMSRRSPCDGKEASPEGASKLPSTRKNCSRRFNTVACTVSKRRPALTVDLFKDDFTRTKTRRQENHDVLRARKMDIVKRSMMSWPSNMDSDEQSPSLPLQRHKSTTRSRVNSRPRINLDSVNSRSRINRMSKVNVATLPRNFAIPDSPMAHETPGSDLAKTRVALSNTVNSDATCFMERPLCRPGVVTSRPSGKRRAVLVRKLRRIGKYFHKLGGGVQAPPQLQILGVV